MQTAMAAFIDAAEREHVRIMTPISASANPRGAVEAVAYDAICDAIVAAATGCDAVMLDLHGAIVIIGPTYTGQRAFMERAAVLDTGTVKLVMTERTHEPTETPS
jgi:microcystin degradation protein MlrC